MPRPRSSILSAPRGRAGARADRPAGADRSSPKRRPARRPPNPSVTPGIPSGSSRGTFRPPRWAGGSWWGRASTSPGGCRRLLSAPAGRNPGSMSQPSHGRWRTHPPRRRCKQPRRQDNPPGEPDQQGRHCRDPWREMIGTEVVFGTGPRIASPRFGRPHETRSDPGGASRVLEAGPRVRGSNDVQHSIAARRHRTAI
jgi:hypothetical protein